MGKMERKQQMCWTCKKACGGSSGCSWFNGFIPIEGWSAEPTIADTILYKGKIKYVKSFRIINCPLYEKQIPVGRVKINKMKAQNLGISLRTYYRRLEKNKRKEKINDTLHK